MMDWWEARNDREKLILLVGAIVAVLLIGFELIWMPIANSVDTLNKQVQSQESLAHWMQIAGIRIKALKKAGFVMSQQQTGSLLVIVEKTLEQAKLNSYLRNVQQPADNQITLSFQSVPFDAFIQWVQSIWQTNGVQVQQLSVTRTDTTGLVDVNLTLSS